MIQGYGSNKFTGSNPNMLPDGLGDFLLEQDYIRDKAWLWDRVGALMADMFNGGVAAGLLLSGGVCTDSGTHQSVNITAGYGYAPFTLNLGTSNTLPPTTSSEDLSPVRVSWGALTAQGVINVFSNATWYVVMQYAETDWLSRLRAKAGGTWAFGKQPSYTLTVTQSAPTAYQILLATIVTGATSGVAWTSITPNASRVNWATALAAALGTGWTTALGASASDFAAALTAGKGWAPIGFVYFQGPADTVPSTLWAGTWTDVSSEEANMGRRVVGSLAGAWVSGTPAILSVSVAGGVPTISVVSGGSGYLSGGSGTIPLIVAGTCTTQYVGNATVTSGVITAIPAPGTAGVGYTSGAVAVYDGVYGHGDLAQGHRHVPLAGGGQIYVRVGSGGALTEPSGGGTIRVDSTTGDPTTDASNGTPRKGPETTGPYMIVKKWRRTA